MTNQFRSLSSPIRIKLRSDQYHERTFSRLLVNPYDAHNYINEAERCVDSGGRVELYSDVIQQDGQPYIATGLTVFYKPHPNYPIIKRLMDLDRKRADVETKRTGDSKL